MIRTPFITAPVAMAHPGSAGVTRPLLGPASIAGMQRAGSSGFSQILNEVLMSRQSRPTPAPGPRQEFPRPMRNLGDAHLSTMLNRSSLRLIPARRPSAGPSRAGGASSSGSEPERLFNAVKSRGRPVDPQTFDGMIKNAASRHQVPEELVKAVIKVESNFNPRATSPVGAMGLMQLMPGTARDLGVQSPYDPSENIEGGTKYLRELLDRYNGSVPKAVAAYNCGMRNVERGILPAETRNYLQMVSRYYNGNQILRTKGGITQIQGTAATETAAQEFSTTRT